jgi:nitroreductase
VTAIDLASVDHALASTRAVRRRLDFDRPVPDDLILECLDLAIQAPTGSNKQDYAFVVVTDTAQKAIVGDAYRRGFATYVGEKVAEDPAAREGLKNAQYLADRMHEAPTLVIPCIEGRVEGGSQLSQASLYGSILPATWSFMIALRARGLGTCWTTLHLPNADEVAAALGIPDNFTQAALTPVAWIKGGDMKPAPRVPASERTYWNTWGATRA